MGLITVIVPIFNVEKYLDRCIKSIVEQTYTNIEIILVDDGSTDSSSYIVDEWAKKDNRIIAVHKSNGGLSDARNYGINISDGDLIGFVDGDDYIEKNMYELLYKNIYIYDADIACCGRFRGREDNYKTLQCLSNVETFSGQEAIRELLLEKKLDTSCCDKLFKRSLFDDVRFPLGEINEDIVVMPHILSKCRTLVHVGKPLYYYCQNDGSITRSGYSQKHKMVYLHLLNLEKFLVMEYPELLDYFLNYYETVLLALLTQIENTLNGKVKYSDDYKKYRREFWRNLPKALLSNKVRIYNKVKYIFYILGGYNFVKR